MTEWQLVGKPALLLVHMQNSICKEPSPIQAMGHARATREDGIIPNIRTLLETFRAKELPVIFVCTYTPEDATLPSYGGFWTGSKEIVVNRMGTPDVEVVDELAPVAGEPVLYNWPFNVFYNTGLQEHLEAQGVETVVLTGVATGMSVGIAAWALAERFYNLIIPSDTCTDGNPALHEMLISAQLPSIALITTAGDVIAHL